MSRLAMVATLAVATAGCSVPYNTPLPVEQTDACQATTDCAAGATCQSGVCLANDVDLTGLELEVIPAATAVYGAGTSYLFSLGGEASHGATFDPVLPSPVLIHGGQFVLGSTMVLGPSCPLVGRSLPGTVTFYPDPPFSGPAVAPVTAMTVTATDGSSSFDAILPSKGAYDVYFVPSPVKGCNGDAAFPPVFIAQSQITDSGALEWTIPTVETLAGSITGFSDSSSAVWTADLVDPNRGLVISSEDTLSCDNGACLLSLELAVADPTSPLASPILRLTPMNPGEPVIYWSLAGTSLAGSDAQFSAAGLLVQPVKVSGTVMDPTGTTGVPATLSIQSTSLTGTVQQNASRTIEGQTTGPDGSFMLDLPPGEYQIRAFPLGGSLAVTEMTVPVAYDLVTTNAECTCQTIKLLLDPQISLTGTVTTPLGDPVANAQVEIAPSQTPGVSFWNSTHALDSGATHVADATTDQDGHFELMVDPGSADLQVVPAPGSGFPWLVLPNTQATSPLPLSLETPGVLQGVAHDPSGNPVAGATVNVWAPLSTPAGTGVMIASATTGSDGSYTLLLPTSP